MCLAVYEGHLAAEQTRMSSACFNRELQNHLHTCPSNQMHRHRGKTGSTFYWARAQGGNFFCCRLFGNFIKLRAYKKKQTNLQSQPLLCLMPDGVTARLPTTTGKEFPRDQSSGGWGTTQDRKSQSSTIYSSAWTLVLWGSQGSKQQVEIKVIHGESKVKAQQRPTHRLNYSHPGSTTASSYLTSICISSLSSLLFLETQWLTFLMKPGLAGSVPWHFFCTEQKWQFAWTSASTLR